jgi:hypothetical protein
MEAEQLNGLDRLAGAVVKYGSDAAHLRELIVDS